MDGEATISNVPRSIRKNVESTRFSVVKVSVTGLLAYGGFINVKLFKLIILGDDVVDSVKLPSINDPSLVVP